MKHKEKCIKNLINNLTILLVSLFIHAPGAVFAGESMTYFSSATSSFTNLDKSSYEYQVNEAPGYGESFYFSAFDDKGNVVTALVSMTNYNPFNKGMGSFDMHWVEGGKVRVVHQEFNADEIKQGNNQGTTFGKYSFINPGISNTEIYYRGEDTEGNAVEIKVNMEHTEPGVQSGDSNLYFGEGLADYWGLKIIAPSGNARASLTTKDGKTSTLNLKAYLDHGKATAKVPDFSDHWYRLHFISDKWTIGMHEITTESELGDRKPQILYVGKNKQALGLFADWEYREDGFKAHPESPYEIPTGWRLKLERDDLKISGTVKVKKEVMAIDVLGSVSWAVRMLVKAFYSNAWQHFLLVEVELDIEHNGVSEKVKGLGLATAEYY